MSEAAHWQDEYIDLLPPDDFKPDTAVVFDAGRRLQMIDADWSEWTQEQRYGFYKLVEEDRQEVNRNSFTFGDTSKDTGTREWTTMALKAILDTDLEVELIDELERRSLAEIERAVEGKTSRELMNELGDIARLPEELLGDTKREYQAAINRLAAQHPEPKRVLQAGEILKYRWFAERGDPLPAEMRLSEKLWPWIRSDALVDEKNIRELRLALEKVNIYQEVITQFRDDYFNTEPKRTEIIEIIENVIIAGEEYRFLKSFMEQPERPDERPLNQAEKQFRARDAEEHIRRHYGLGEGEPLRHHPSAMAAYGRELYQIDESTIYNRRDGADPAARRFLAYIIARLAATDQPEHVAKIDWASMHISHSGDDEGELVGYDIHGNLVQDFGEEVMQRLEFLSEIDGDIGLRLHSDFSDYLADELLRELLQSESRDFESALRYAIAANAQQFTSDLTDVVNNEGFWAPPDPITVDNGPYQGHRRLFGRSYHQAQHVENDGRQQQATTELAAEQWTSSDVCTREEYERDMAESIAELTRTGGDFRKRLVDLNNLHTGVLPLPHKGMSTVLGISLSPAAGVPERGIPQIAGLKPVAQDETGQVFYNKAEHDPYVVPEIALPVDGQNELAEEYFELGLHDLSDALSDKHLTVSELASLIAKNGVYSFNPYYSVPMVRGLQDFKQAVHKGKLQVQCTGAAGFLKHSLDTAFKDTKAKIVTGHMVSPARDYLPLAGHAQVAIEHGSKTYIIDATPSRQDAEQAPESSRFETIEQAEYIAQNRPVPTAVELRQQLETRLQVVLDAPQGGEQLYAKAFALGEQNPVFRALSLAVRATQNTAEKDEAERLISYLDGYMQADEHTLRAAKLPLYQPQTLHMLRGFAQELSSIG